MPVIAIKNIHSDIPLTNVKVTVQLRPLDFAPLVTAAFPLSQPLSSEHASDDIDLSRSDNWKIAEEGSELVGTTTVWCDQCGKDGIRFGMHVNLSSGLLVTKPNDKSVENLANLMLFAKDHPDRVGEAQDRFKNSVQMEFEEGSWSQPSDRGTSTNGLKPAIVAVVGPDMPSSDSLEEMKLSKNELFASTAKFFSECSFNRRLSTGGLVPMACHFEIREDVNSQLFRAPGTLSGTIVSSEGCKLSFSGVKIASSWTSITGDLQGWTSGDFQVPSLGTNIDTCRHNDVVMKTKLVSKAGKSDGTWKCTNDGDSLNCMLSKLVQK